MAFPWTYENEVEDINRVIRLRKSKDRQNIGQKKKGQTKVYKTKDRVTQNWNGK